MAQKNQEPTVTYNKYSLKCMHDFISSVIFYREKFKRADHNFQNLIRTWPSIRMQMLSSLQTISYFKKKVVLKKH